MSRKGIPGDRFAQHAHREHVVACAHCTGTFRCVGMKARRYCDECLPIITKARKKIASAKANAKRRGKFKRPAPAPKPRLVRYAGFDPSERH